MRSSSLPPSSSSSSLAVILSLSLPPLSRCAFGSGVGKSRQRNRQSGGGGRSGSRSSKDGQKKKSRLSMLREMAFGPTKPEEEVAQGSTAAKPKPKPKGWNGERDRIPKTEKAPERLRPVSDPGVKPFTVVRARSRWRDSSQHPSLLHPLKPQAFFENFIGQKAFVLRRGPLHPRWLEKGRAMHWLSGEHVGKEAEVLRGSHSASSSSSSSIEGVARHRIAKATPARLSWEKGLAVRFGKVGPHISRLGWADERLMKRLRRLAPGRGLGTSLYGAPNGSRLVWPHEDVHSQLILQVYGSRRWTLCTRGMVPSSQTDAPAGLGSVGVKRPVGASCESVVLRRTDVLYLPSYTWHWADAGSGDAWHLGFEFATLTGFDLVRGLGSSTSLLPGLLRSDAVRDYSSAGAGRKSVPSPALALFAPLPLWHAPYAEEAAQDVSNFCPNLPWDPSKDVSSICSLVAVRVAIMRLTGFNGRRPRGNRTHPSGSAAASGGSNATNPGPKGQRTTPRRWLSKSTIKWIRDASEVFFFACGFLFLVWLVCGVATIESDETGPGRVGQPLSRRSKAWKSTNRPRKKQMKQE